MGAFHQRVFGMTTTAVLVEFFSTEWIVIIEYLNKNNEQIHPTGKHWVNDGIVPAPLVYQLVRAERYVGALIIGCTYFVLPWCLVLYLVCSRNAISSPQYKSTASHGYFCLWASSCCLKLSFICAFLSYMYWQGWIAMGLIFLLNVWVS